MTTTIAHDRAGNMTKVPIPGDWSDDFDLTFDAWNRLVAVEDGSEIVAEYEYDGRNFRITKTTEEEIRHYFYTQNWQCVEERATADDSDVPAPEDLDPDMQYVWGLRYIDDLILHDRDTSTPKNGTLDERLYAMQDANWNVVALADSDGDVVERYLYSAYGDPLVLNADFAEDSDGTDYAWEFRFTGRRTDLETDLMYYRNRMYHPGLGRFVSRDPVGYRGGSNIYQYAIGSPVLYRDPRGLKASEDPVTVTDIGYCLWKLDWARTLGWVRGRTDAGYACASALLSRFLEHDRANQEPHCPASCKKALKGLEFLEGPLMHELDKTSKCEAQSKVLMKIDEGSYEYEQDAGGLYYAFKALTFGAFVHGTSTCGKRQSYVVDGKKTCCCKCSADLCVHYTVRDTYDFCSSLPDNAKRYSLAWCGCVLERASNALAEMGFSNIGGPFDISCSDVVPDFGVSFRHCE